MNNNTDQLGAMDIRVFMVTAVYVVEDEPNPVTLHLGIHATSVGAALDRVVADLGDLAWVRIILMDAVALAATGSSGVDYGFIVEREPLRSPTDGPSGSGPSGSGFGTDEKPQGDAPIGRFS